MHPDEGDGRGAVDAAAVKVAGGRRDDAADEQADDDAGRLHDRGAEALAEDDGHKDGEAEAEVLCGAPGQGVGGGDVRALGEEARGADVGAGAGAAGPVHEAGLDQVDSDEHDGRAGDDWWEDAEEDPGRHEGDEDFDQGAAGGGSEDGAVGIGAGQEGAVLGDGAEAVGVHLLEAARGNRDDGERDADDGDEAGSDVVAVPELD